MIKKLVGIDLDGTLFDEAKEVPQVNVDAIKEGVKHGYAFCFASGRIGPELDRVKGICPEIRYALMGNGAIIVDLETNEVMFKDALEMDLVAEIYDRLKDMHMLFELFDAEMIPTDADKYDHIQEYGVKQYYTLLRTTRTPIEHFEEYIHTRKEQVGKINIFFNTVEERDEAIRRTKDLPVTTTYQKFPINLEFNAPTVHKGVGLSNLAKFLNVPMEDTVAFGDNHNDIGMMKAAGFAVAMGNAIDEIKESADYICESNDDGGVGKTLYRMINGEL